MQALRQFPEEKTGTVVSVTHIPKHLSLRTRVRNNRMRSIARSISTKDIGQAVTQKNIEEGRRISSSLSLSNPTAPATSAE
jgi:hypothetical protein